MAENGRINNKEIYERITRVETQMTGICKDIKEIKNNHLHSLELKVDKNTEKIASLQKYVWMAAGGLAVLQTIIEVYTR